MIVIEWESVASPGCFVVVFSKFVLVLCLCFVLPSVARSHLSPLALLPPCSHLLPLAWQQAMLEAFHIIFDLQKVLLVLGRQE